MNTALHEFVVLAAPDDPLHPIIAEMAQGGDRFFGLALIVDDSMTLLGVINTGDVLRLLADGVALTCAASEVMIREPITAPAGASDQEIIQTVRSQLLLRSGGQKDLTQYVPLIDEAGVLCDVVDVFSLLAASPRQGDHVVVYGLGFVGLTLSVALAGRGHYVTGVDNNTPLVQQLLKGNPHVFEPRLPDMLRRALADKHLSLQCTPPDQHHRVVVIAVGTPVSDDGSASLTALNAVCTVVGKRLKRGDLIMLRSTVPVGTTRGLVRSLLEMHSGLTAGIDFHLAFTPERTVEGDAMQELTSLPQIVGGLTSRCAEKATSFWQTLTDSVVLVDNLEASELVKLVNNSYRDLSFAFANGLALLSDRFNLDAARVIAAANEGYPRNPIPKPSPGVGGYCLTKDPFLYSCVSTDSSHAILSSQGREVNRLAGLYPIQVIHKFAQRIQRPIKDLSVLVIGLAFKGVPETNDLRSSCGVTVCNQLSKLGCTVFAYDNIVNSTEIEALGISHASPHSVADICDAVLIMNNHPSNIPEGFVSRLQGRSSLIFDGWSLLDRHDVEQYDGLTYATMGYMTPGPIAG